MADSKAVAKKQESNVVEFDMSVLEADASVGFENIGQEDLALPFLKVLSGNDPVLDDRNFKGRKGDIYNTVTGECFDGEKVSRLYRVPTNVASFNGHHEDRAAGLRLLYSPEKNVRKQSVRLTTIKITSKAAKATTSKKRISTLCCL